MLTQCLLVSSFSFLPAANVTVIASVSVVENAAFPATIASAAIVTVVMSATIATAASAMSVTTGALLVV